MQKFMFTEQKTVDYIFEARDIVEAEDIAGLIKAVKDEEVARLICAHKNGDVYIDEVEHILEEE